jgi:hypothetical protein
MLLGARGERGEISGESLDESFEALSDLVKLTLSELPPRPGMADASALQP